MKTVASFLMLIGLLVLSLNAPAQLKPGSAKPLNIPSLKCTPPVLAKKNEPVTYWVGATKLSAREKARIAQKWGKVLIPAGETKRAVEIRREAEAYFQKLIDEYESVYAQWLTLRPDATEQEKQDWRKILDEAIRGTRIPNIEAQTRQKRI